MKKKKMYMETRILPYNKDMEFFEIQDVITYNYTFNFIFGMRDGGKTFSALYYCLSNFVKYGKKFFYGRRSKEEISTVKDVLFKGVAPYFPDVEIMNTGKKIFIRKVGTKEWEVLGYCVAFSNMTAWRGPDYFDVSTIIFDEYIKLNENQRWLGGSNDAYSSKSRYDADVAEDLYASIARSSNKNRLRVFFLSNAGYMANPIFVKYRIKISDFMQCKIVRRRDRVLKKDNMLFYFYHSELREKLQKEKHKGKLSERYIGYAFDSAFFDNDETMVVPNKPNGFEPINIVTDGQYKLYIWGKKEDTTWYYWISTTKSIKDNVVETYSINPRSIEEETIQNNFIKDKLQKMAGRRLIQFHDSITKGLFIDLIYG